MYLYGHLSAPRDHPAFRPQLAFQRTPAPPPPPNTTVVIAPVSRPRYVTTPITALPPVCSSPLVSGGTLVAIVPKGSPAPRFGTQTNISYGQAEWGFGNDVDLYFGYPTRIVQKIWTGLQADLAAVNPGVPFFNILTALPQPSMYLHLPCERVGAPSQGASFGNPVQGGTLGHCLVGYRFDTRLKRCIPVACPAGQVYIEALGKCIDKNTSIPGSLHG